MIRAVKKGSHHMKTQALIFSLFFFGILPSSIFSAEPLNSQGTIEVYPRCIQGTPTLIKFVPVISENGSRYSVFFGNQGSEVLQPLKWMTHNLETGEIIRTESEIQLNHFPTVQDLVDTFSMSIGMPNGVIITVMDHEKTVDFSENLKNRGTYSFQFNLWRVMKNKI